MLLTKFGISNHEQVEFDNEEDCDAYNDEEIRRKEEEEKESWLDEYCHRINDRYWKNDSDYDEEIFNFLSKSVQYRSPSQIFITACSY